MSAYMVDKDHIDFLVQSAIAGATDSRGWDSRHEQHFSYSQGFAFCESMRLRLLRCLPSSDKLPAWGFSREAVA